MEDYTIDYNERMINRYPEIIKAIKEFQVLIASQSEQVEELHDGLTNMMGNVFIETSDANRISAWEKVLGITPTPKGDQEDDEWLDSRRSTILARLYFSEKLNTKSIADIVSIFTSCATKSWLIDDTIYVKIYTSENDKSFNLDSIISELKRKCPLHLNLVVYKTYTTWNTVKSKFPTWGEIAEDAKTWNGVKFNFYEDDYTTAVHEYIVDEDGDSIMDEFNKRLFN